jgi:hypothetical protein
MKTILKWNVSASRTSLMLKTCVIIAVGFSAVLANASLTADQTGAAKAEAAANASTPSIRAALPVAPSPTPPRPHLAPAAPMNSSVPAVSVGEDIRDIRAPRHLPSNWPWVAGAAGALVLGSLSWLLWRRHLRNALFARLPYEIALEQLEAARCYLTPEQAREFCFAVSEIIRRYIEQRFNARAPRRTTEEFLYDLLEEKHIMLSSQRALLAEFLQHCDMAKFALWQFSVPEMEAMHQSARAFVLQTAVEHVANGGPQKADALPKSPRVHLDPPVLNCSSGLAAGCAEAGLRTKQA